MTALRLNIRMLEKTYAPAAAEARHYPRFEQSGLGRADATSQRPRFTIMMPPPNVTGSLHMGHALNATLHDILCRYHRMRGFDVLYLPGTDHAGIATQMVVERQLDAQNISRHDMGRENFLKRVWEWKAESGGTITGQLRRLGVVPDWSRERFTMDDGLSHAVRYAFVKLYRDGLIYRAKRLVNWDVQLQTAVSDLEVLQKEIKGNLWHINYAIDGMADRTITIATTRPETMLGDTAIVVHPDDERYQDLIGKQAVLPLVGRLIPIIADDYVDMAMGTGAMKVTPAHDFNDFALGQKHALAQINILTATGHLNDDVPAAYRGMERFAARTKIVADLEAIGALAAIVPHTHMVPHGDRSGTVIEPFLTDQWYVDAATLAKPALAAVRSGKTEFVPKNWENTYFQWLDNIQPWCISRQLWWGHQIPAWYDDAGNFYVAETEAEAIAQAGGKPLRRDDDVLDTWFSSALWPFSTLGWMNDDNSHTTPDLAAYYPGNVLITGFDIIFFWVARMMMFGLYFMGDVPFRQVYIHALVRDASGAKMSKSKGNVIDPLSIVDDLGCDALRFTLAALSAQGRDVKLSPQRVEGYRNFVTKLWNAARFAEMHHCALAADYDPARNQLPLNRWIITKLQHTLHDYDVALQGYKFNAAAQCMYEFVWDIVCDWYVEFSKPYLQAENATPEKTEIQQTLAYVLDISLRLLHPIMPFVTEELNNQLLQRDDLVMGMAIPAPNPAWQDNAAEAEIDLIIQIISSIRSVRSTLNVPASLQLPLLVHGANAATEKLLQHYQPLILRLARLASIETAPAANMAGAAQILVREATYLLPVADVVDIAAETTRLGKTLAKLHDDISRIETKLGNAQFVQNAPEEIIEEQQEKLADLQDNHQRLSAALRLLNG